MKRRTQAYIAAASAAVLLGGILVLAGVPSLFGSNVGPVQAVRPVAGGDGEVVVEGPGAGDSMSVEARQLGSQRSVEVRARPGFEVVVKDRSGSPIEEATVSVTRVIPQARESAGLVKHALTDRYGTAIINLESYSSYMVVVNKGGYGAVRLYAHPGRVNVVLEQSVFLTGRITSDATGEAVPGAAVKLVPIGGTRGWRLVADEEGEYGSDEVAPGMYDLWVVAAGYLRYEMVEIALTPRPTVNRVDVTLFDGVDLRGTVEDSRSGLPLSSGRLVALYGDRECGYADISASGGFWMRGLPQREVMFRVEAPGYSSSLTMAHVESSPLEQGGTGYAPVIIRAAPCVSVGGVVRCEGRPVKDALVAVARGGIVTKLRQVGRGLNGVAGVGFAITDSSGRFRVNVPGVLPEMLGNGMRGFELVVMCGGYVPELVTIGGSEYDVNEIEVPLVEGGGVAVSAVTAVGVAASAAKVSVDPVGGMEELAPVMEFLGNVHVLDERGETVITGLWPGTWRVSAELEGGEEGGSVDVVVVDGGLVDARITTAWTDRFFGRVVDRSGNAVSGALVQLRHGQWIERAETNEQGAYSLGFPHWPSANAIVSGGRVIGSQSFDVEVGQEGMLLVEGFGDVVRVEGEVRDSVTHRLIPIVSRRVCRELGRLGGQHVDERLVLGGRFVLELPVPCEGDISFSATGYEGLSVEIAEAARGGQPLVVQLDPEAHTGASAIVVVEVASVFGDAAVVAFDSSGREVARGRVINDRQFAISIDGVGEARIMAYSNTGCSVEPAYWTLGERAPVLVECRAGGGWIEGIVRGPVDGDVLIRDRHGLCLPTPIADDGSFSTLRLWEGQYSLILGGEEVGVVDVHDGSPAEFVWEHR